MRDKVLSALETVGQTRDKHCKQGCGANCPFFFRKHCIYADMVSEVITPDMVRDKAGLEMFYKAKDEMEREAEDALQEDI